ncbi:MAG: zinc ribbon domain-containing protein [Phycisphaerales bacterium]|nr:zinc ribbon domain-containing protein [Phycisphaerales bacterium]
MAEQDSPINPERLCPRCLSRVYSEGLERCPDCGASLVPTCTGCGYDLTGLPRTADCPECGTPIEYAYLPDRLEHRPVEYLVTLKNGLTIVLVAILAQVAMGVLGIVVAIVGAAMGGFRYSAASAAATTGRGGLLVRCSRAYLAGWWLATTPQPRAVAGGLDVGPRRVIRVALVVQVGIAIANLVVKPLLLIAPINMASPSWPLMAVMALASKAAWITEFFACMLYIRWLARRIPDPSLEAEAKRFMWLGPLLYVVLACVIVGPTIALVMYWMMVRKLRAYLSGIIQVAELRGAMAVEA